MALQTRLVDRTAWAMLWAWLATAGLIGLTGALLSLCGCDKANGKTSASAKVPAELQSDQPMSAGEVLKAFRPYLAVVDTSWEECPSLLTGWIKRASHGTGIVVVSDGQRALVLTSRRQVDPRFARDNSPRTRNVMFRVSTPGQRTAGEYQYARLVALYMNDTDLALLSIPSPEGGSFVVPVASNSQLRAGDKVLAVGQPSGLGFAMSEVMVNNFWQGAGAKVIEVSIPDGTLDTLGPIFTQKRVALAGMMSGTPQAPAGKAVGAATPADCLFKPERWDYLIEEGTTRQLLNILQ